jgi:hypothetical protein
MINYNFLQFFLILLLIIQLIKLQPEAAFLIDADRMPNVALLVLALLGEDEPVGGEGVGVDEFAVVEHGVVEGSCSLQ